jgi:HSP20 family protein
MFLTTTRRPYEGLQTLRRLNNVLDEAFGNWPLQQDESGSITSAWHPAVDVFEDKDAVKIVAELPGVKPEDVKLSLESNLLTIRGEKKQEAEERTERVHRYDLRAGVRAAEHGRRREDLRGI